VLAAASAVLGVTNVYIQYHLANRSRATWLPWLASAVLVALIALSNHTPTTIAASVLLVSGLCLAGLVMAAFFHPLEPEADALESASARRRLWSGAGDIDVTVVVPHFNAGPKLVDNIRNIISVLERTGTSFEVITVSDGSTDGSEKALAGQASEHKPTVAKEQKQGKGEALRIGLSMGRGRYLGFIDADGDLNPTLLEPFIALMKLYEPDIILGSKRHALSEVQYPPIRRVYSWGYQQLIRVLFRMNIRDTQTGLKFVRREVIAEVLPRMLEKRFAFDLEMFVVARHVGYRRFLEAPVRIEHQFTSTINVQSVWGMLLDTLAIYYRLHILRYYDRPVTRSALSDSSPSER
jgi:glycosyltransferase involved in cell wall biosynthesis